MGLCSAPATFQTLMNSIFSGVINNVSNVYFDDYLIFSNSEKDHLSHLTLVLRRLKEHNTYLSPKKCYLFEKRV